MNVSNQINNVINNIASKLGMAANQISGYVKQLFALYVHQAYISGIKSILWCAIGLIVIILSIIVLKKSISLIINDDYNKKYNENWTIIKIVISSCLIFSFAIVLIIDLNNIINAFGNPQYWAYQHVLSNLSGYLGNSSN
jgi:flagellar biosynthesis protein FlhB